MSDAIVCVDTSAVREGAVEELKAGLRELVDFVAVNERRMHVEVNELQLQPLVG